MGTLSPAVADAFYLLQMDLYGHLDEAESLATTFEEWADQDTDTARKLISDLVLVIRGLLLEHQVKPSSDCRICASPWPCPVVTAIHGLLKDPQHQFVALANRVHKMQSDNATASVPIVAADRGVAGARGRWFWVG